MLKKMFDLGVIHLFHQCHPYGKTSGSRYSKRQADGCDRCVPARQDYNGVGKPDSGTGGITEWEDIAGTREKCFCGGNFHVKLIDASPIGINIRSTVATYANVHDELQERFTQN